MCFWKLLEGGWNTIQSIWEEDTEEDTPETSAVNNANWMDHEFNTLIAWMMLMIELKRERRGNGERPRQVTMDWELGVEAMCPHHRPGRGVRMKVFEIGLVIAEQALQYSYLLHGGDNNWSQKTGDPVV